MSNYMQPSQDPDCVDAEVVYNGGDKKERIFNKYGDDGFKNQTNGEEKLKEKLNGNSLIRGIFTLFSAIGAILVLIGIVLLVFGFMLCATIAGALFGIPMILIGGILFSLGVSFIRSNSTGKIRFGKFP